MPKQTEVFYSTPNQPRQVRLDTVGNACNAFCLSCHRFLSSRKGDMSISMIAQILEDISQWNTPLTEIVPVNYGELFMRKDWYLILTMLANKLPRTGIVLPTNGALLDADKVSQLCRIPTLRIINFSINAFFDETYEEFMGLKAENIRKIEVLIKQLKAERPDIVIWASMVFDPQYCSDLQRDAFINHWRQFAFPQIIPAASAGRGTQIKILRTIPCRSIFSDFVIGYDGKLSSCCFDANMHLDLGYFTNNIKGDWRNPKLENLRKLHNQHRRQEIPLCKDCTYE